MGQITAIKPQRRKARFNIFIDGVFVFGLDAGILLKEGLKIGQELSQGKVAEIIKENEFSSVFNKTLKFLSYRARSEKEVNDWFKKKQFGEIVQKQVIDKLKELKFLNDEEFARMWVEQRNLSRPRSLRLIKIELRQKGISDETIEDQISKIKDQKQDDLNIAREIVQKKMSKYKGQTKQEIFKKLGGFLARRGFSYDVIKQSIDEELSEVV